MRAKKGTMTSTPGPVALEAVVEQAVDVTKKAKRYKKSLSGDNFYANKLVDLRAEAANIFRDLSGRSVGDVSAMAEMLQEVFSPAVSAKRRLKVLKELVFALRTTWRDSADSVAPAEDIGLFLLSILAETRRGYLVSIGRQMNGSYISGWYDACAVMLRRLLEVSIIEAFEAKAIANKIKDGNGNYLQLTDLIQRAIAETTWTLSRNTRQFLPQLRELGHMSAHGRYYNTRREDIERIRQAIRAVIEEFLHHANLL